MAPNEREGIAVGYIPLDAVRADINALCTVAETHRLTLPPAEWGAIKVGAGAPPIRIAEGWLAVIHGVDELAHPDGSALLRYCAGIIIHDAVHLDRILYRSPHPLFVPEVRGEIRSISATSSFRPASIAAASARSTFTTEWPIMRSGAAG